MALSDEEQRLLEQMEAALAAEDPKLVNTLRGTGVRRVHRRRAAMAGVGFFAGLALLVAGISSLTPVLSVVGFVIMVAAAVTAIYSWQHVGQQRGPHRGRDRPRTPQGRGPSTARTSWTRWRSAGVAAATSPVSSTRSCATVASAACTSARRTSADRSRPRVPPNTKPSVRSRGGPTVRFAHKGVGGRTGPAIPGSSDQSRLRRDGSTATGATATASTVRQQAQRGGDAAADLLGHHRQVGRRPASAKERA